MTHTFQVQGKPVFLGALAKSFPAWLKTQGYRQIFVLTDHNTRRFCLPYFLEKSGLPAHTPVMEIPAGENEKSLASSEKIWAAMLSAKLDRQALVLNLGGGVVGDIGGFCAATWKRGVDFAQIPTTLLAMTDAAIGGKTGIDFQGLKNILGVFHQPAAVFADPFFLQTLPERELRSGFAEVIKHAFIGGPELLEWIGAPDFHLHQLLGSSTGYRMLEKSISVKARVVNEDPLEHGLRALLNFGHSIGHALESYFLPTPDPLTHGEAIAIGMLCESFGSPIQSQVARLVLRHFPARPIPQASFPEIWACLQHDKKNASGKLRMAVPGDAPFRLKILEPTQQNVEQALLFFNSLCDKT